jgi:hypothetical protein
MNEFMKLEARELEAVQGGFLHALLVPIAVITTGAVLIGRELSGGGGGVPQDLINFAASGGKVRPPA